MPTVHQPAILKAAEWVGLELDGEQLGLLERFELWLKDEAARVGGVGPAEGSILGWRHVADSLLFAYRWARDPPDRVLDIGSGVGLPAIPLAIALPQVEVLSLDRSARRIRLQRRAARILGLDNLVPVESDAGAARGDYAVVVSRAALPPQELKPHLQRLTAPGGIAVVGGSHITAPMEAGFETVAIPPEVLDHSVWILIMARP